MNEKLRKNWRQFKESSPGRRFQDRYERRQDIENGRFDPRKILNLGVGVGLILAGLFMVAFPGPGWVTVFLGLGFIAGELGPVARFMDKLEMRARDLAEKVLKFWGESSTTVRILVVTLALLLVAVLATGAFLLVF